jgi:hypothetical protein
VIDQAALTCFDVVRRPARVFHSPGVSSSGRVVEGWEALLDRYVWDWFATYTFKDEVHPERADKVFRVWMSKLQKSVAGASWYKRPSDTVRWARGLEWQKRGVLHYHVLLSHRLGLNQIATRKAWEQEWTRLTEAFCSIYPCDSSGAVRAYIAKYCGKGGEVDLSQDLPTVEAGRALQRA